MFNLKKRLGAVSVILVAAMVCTLVFNVVLCGDLFLKKSPIDDIGVDTSLTTSGSFKESNLSMDSIREQYIDQELVQRDIASYDGEQWVIVELDGTNLFSAYKAGSRYATFGEYAASLEGRKLKSNIQKAQSSFLNALDKRGINYTYKCSYSTVNNGIALKVDADGFNAIKNMNGVKGVYYSEYYSVPEVQDVNNNAHVYTTGIYDSSALKDEYQGEGMVVAILDTGLDYTHPAFNTPLKDVSKAKWQSAADLAAVLEAARANETTPFYAVGSAEELFVSEKVPFAYDYADDDANVFPGYSNHGTHVAGIVAGQDDKKIIDDKGNDDPSDDETFVGVAPQAQLAIFKVFTDNLESDSLGGANSIDILRAVSDCVLLGVDVINMSLGMSAGFADEKSNNFLNDIYDSVEKAGISLIVAASNDYSSGFGGGNGTNLASNPDSGTVGSPGTYSAAMSVASINGQLSQYIKATFVNSDETPIAFITNSSDNYGNELKFVDQLYESAEKTPGETLKFKYVVIPGLGKDTNYNAAIKRELNTKTYRGEAVDGTIALIKRGETTFAEKVGLAKSNNATAAIVYNNVSGTIRMSLGELTDPIPACSISMDAANAILDLTTGITGLFEISTTMQAGPFMSEFSSWGPTPDLRIKPEITAHGGEITSAVPSGLDDDGQGGHSYDILSGTSMAAPNMAGAVALLRQYVKEKQGLDGQELSDRVYQLLMSTATIAKNEEGNPYAVRKQGAGLADIASAVNAEAYLTTGDYETPDSRTKLELGDDPDKKGVYTMSFNLINTSNAQQTYDPITYVMTETLASDEKTVAEKSFMFAPSNDGVNYADVTYKVNGVDHTGPITVGVNEHLRIEVTVTLTQAARDYMVNSKFVNGMYVEGFVSLDNQSASGVTLNVPYLAFYGDWNDAPLFDYDIYEISESEQNEEEVAKQLKATAAATQVVGIYYDDEMLLPLGQYIYEQDEDEVQVYPSKDKLAVSMYDDTAQRTIYELYCVWAGLLRNAAYVDVVITNARTGELVYADKQENVRKSYAAGGSNVGARVLLELNPYEWGMMNNDEYNVSVIGQLDYQNNNGDPETSDPKALNPANNRFDFKFSVDYESPKLMDYRIRFQPIEVNNQIKYRIWMDLDVYDNQYIMDVIPGYQTRTESRWEGEYDEKTGEKVIRNSLNLMTEYPIPVNSSQKGQTSTVSIEITDYYEEYVKTGQMYLQVEDYALNSSIYQIYLDEDSLRLPESNVSFITDNKLVLPEGGIGDNADGSHYDLYRMQMQPNELYTLNTAADIDSFDKFIWRFDDKNNGYIKAKGNQIFAAGNTNGQWIKAYLTDASNQYDLDETNNDSMEGEHIYAAVEIKVEGTALAAPRVNGISLRAIKAGGGFVTPASGGVELNPNSDIPLVVDVSPWYCDVPDGYAYTSSNNDVASVDENGVLHTKKLGSATIIVAARGLNRMQASFTAVVGMEFDVRNYTLYNCYGKGVVEVPSDLNIMYISEYCFRNNPDITEVILPDTLLELPQGAFMGSANLEKVTIKGQCTTIGMFAFRDCPNLREIVLENFVDSKHNLQDSPGAITVGQYAFQNCPKLTTIQNWPRITTVYDMAFAQCTSLESVDISSVHTAGNSIFYGCSKLSNVTMSPSTQIGEYMFDACTSLKSIELKTGNIPDGTFIDCNKLDNVTFAPGVKISNIGAEAFKNTALTKLTLPDGKVTIGADAFANCANLEEIALSSKTELNFEDGIVTAIIDYVPATSSRDEEIVDENEDGLPDYYVDYNVAMKVNPFEGSPKFKKYSFVGGSSEIYTLKDNALYSLDGETLISVPCAVDSFTLDANVKKIGALALAGVKCVKTLDLAAAGITEIGKFAFAQSGLTSITLPTTIDKLEDGALFDCDDLVTVTNLGNFKEIGQFALAYDEKVETVSLSSAQKIDDYAFFYDRKLATVVMTGVTYVGDYAFAATIISEVNLPNVEHIGAHAFYSCWDNLSKTGNNLIGLKSVTLGGVKEFGDEAFAENLVLASVTLGEGTTYIPSGAFLGLVTYDYNDNLVIVSAIATITLPDSLEEIGDMAFAGAVVEDLDLKKVKYVGENAFFYTDNLATLKADNVEYIGDGAFYQGTSDLKVIDLPKAKIIGQYAFAHNNEVEQIKLGAAEYIGSYAFIDIQSIATVTLPETLQAYAIDRWYTYDEKGFVEQDQNSPYEDNYYGEPRQRYVKGFGDGVFGGSTLQAIIMAGGVEEKVVVDGKEKTGTGNGTYFSLEGVLYSKKYEYVELSDDDVDKYEASEVVTLNGRPYHKEFIGYQLEQYNVGNMRLGTYTVIDNTVSIGNSAFMGATGLTEVTLPYSVETIGASAFIDTGITTYYFNSVEAPTLIAEYNDYLNQSLLITDYYNNFVPASIYAEYYDLITVLFADIDLFRNHLLQFFDKGDPMLTQVLTNFVLGEGGFGLSAVIPLNGTGYDTFVWRGFFNDIQRTNVNLPNRDTHEAIEKIEALPSIDTISAFKSQGYEAFSESGVIAQVQAARAAYNKIVDPIQAELAADAYAKLAEAERVVREVLKALGRAVRVSNVTASRYITDYESVDSPFDTTGLTLTVTFEDGSIIIVDGSAIRFSEIKTRKIELAAGITTNQYYVEGDWVDENGESHHLDFVVNITPSIGGGDAPAASSGKLSAGAIAGIAVAAAVVVLAIVAAVVIIILKKKGVLKKKDDNGDDDSDSISDDGHYSDKQVADSEESDADELDDIGDIDD